MLPEPRIGSACRRGQPDEWQIVGAEGAGLRSEKSEAVAINCNAAEHGNRVSSVPVMAPMPTCVSRVHIIYLVHGPVLPVVGFESVFHSPTSITAKLSPQKPVLEDLRVVRSSAPVPSS
jgi:hypothetical protein